MLTSNFASWHWSVFEELICIFKFLFIYFCSKFKCSIKYRIQYIFQYFIEYFLIYYFIKNSTNTIGCWQMQKKPTHN